MTHFLTSKKTLLIAALALVGGIGFTNLHAQASTTGDLLRCKSNSRDRVVLCCNTVIQNVPKPLWLVESNATCNAVVVCNSRKSKSYDTFVAKAPKQQVCYVRIPTNDSQGSSGPNSPAIGKQSEKPFRGK